MQILAHLYSISSHLATAAIHPGSQFLPPLYSYFLSSFIHSLFLIRHYSSFFLSLLTTCFLFLISVFLSHYPFITTSTTTLPTLISPISYFSLFLFFHPSQAVRKVSNRDAALRIMRGNRRSPTASACSSPYSKGISPTVEEDRAIKEAALEPER